MVDKKKQSLLDKEKQLQERILKAKKDLHKLKQKRITECGRLMVKHGLDRFDKPVLESALSRLAAELSNEG